MPSKGKTKGYNHEKSVADLLSEWAGRAFHRVPSSGALRWNDGMFTYGDIVPPEELPIVMECKWHKDNGSLAEVLRKPSDTAYLTWWWYTQTVPDAKRAEEGIGRKFVPLLVTKRNNIKDLITMDMDVWVFLDASRTSKLRYLTFWLPDTQDELVVTPLREFLAVVSYEHFRDVISRVGLQTRRP